MIPEHLSLEEFWVIGINYKNTTTAERGRFAVNEVQYEAILEAASKLEIEELFVLSTCNRTEIYAWTPHPELINRLFEDYTFGDINYFKEKSYRIHGKDAISHIFKVSAGLDSQILGDYEIIAQMKRAIHFSKERNGIGIYTDRLFKYVLQACRAIRSKTDLSSGTVSVAHAAVLFLKNQMIKHGVGRVLIIGLGQIGTNTCKNLQEFFPKNAITLMNRNRQKAEAVAKTLGTSKVRPYEEKNNAIKEADAVFVATNAPQPILTVENFNQDTEKILLDLSIPNNIDPKVKNIPGITLADVDELSSIADKTLVRRQQEVSAAQTYITTYIHKFAEWYLMRRNVPMLKGLKKKLRTLNQQLSQAEKAQNQELMQRIINKMAGKMKKENPQTGCYYIEAINGFLNKVSEKKEGHLEEN